MADSCDNSPQGLVNSETISVMLPLPLGPYDYLAEDSTNAGSFVEVPLGRRTVLGHAIAAFAGVFVEPAVAAWTVAALAIGLSDIRSSWASISATSGAKPFQTSDPATLGNAEKLLAGNFDLVFVFPWPGTEALHCAVFDQFASPGAMPGT